jgi:hypothetical protein
MTTPTPDTLPFTTRLLAFFCRVCPFCLVARARPESAFARFMGKAEANCPACRAYRAVRKARGDNETP